MIDFVATPWQIGRAMTYTSKDWHELTGRIMWLAEREGCSIEELSIRCGLKRSTLRELGRKSHGGSLSGSRESYRSIILHTKCASDWLLFNIGRPFPAEPAEPLEVALEKFATLPGEFAAALREWNERTARPFDEWEWTFVISRLVAALTVDPEDLASPAHHESDMPPAVSRDRKELPQGVTRAGCRR